jgi:hypothetical protein
MSVKNEKTVLMRDVEEMQLKAFLLGVRHGYLDCDKFASEKDLKKAKQWWTVGFLEPPRKVQK